MNNKTNFFIKVVTSIYNIKIFSKYAKEGILRAVSYSMLLTLIVAVIKSMFIEHEINKFELNSFIDIIVNNFGISFFNFLINCLIVSAVASIFTIFMRMIVKYFALYSLTLYAATLPLIVQTILETINPDINFDTMFIVGTLTYVVLILQYIKDDIINNINSRNHDN